MAKRDWNEITRENVITAIKTFLSDTPEYPAPRSTFLIYDGHKLPAKHIRGMAYRVAFGTEIKKNEYAGGLETVRFFEKLGFEVSYTGKVKNDNQQPEHEAISPKEKQPVVKAAQTDIVNIRIPSKGVIEQKNALQLLLNKLFNGDVVCEKTFPWMKTPGDIVGEYFKVYEILSNYRGNTTFAKKNVTLRCDFVVESQRLIIEYDERQHFTEARRLSLLAYTNVALNYDKQKWISACDTIQARDNDPANRDEIRAYYDSVRDIRAAEQGYKLVRIMHGQNDFSRQNAINDLKRMLDHETHDHPNKRTKSCQKKSLRVALYLQTSGERNRHNFKKSMSLVKKSDADLLVLPEACYTPFIHKIEKGSICDPDDFALFRELCLDLGKQIKKPVIVSSQDKYGKIFSLYVNPFSNEKETRSKLYIKHTMTDFSAFDLSNYREIAAELFQPILLGDFKIGMTICYDCNHALFSRLYGLGGIDVIVNGTGGNVVFDKWYKYNQARAIENNCYTFITMGGNETDENPNCYVFGFTPTGHELIPTCLNTNDKPKHNVPGAIYIFDTALDTAEDGIDASIDQQKRPNKQSDCDIPVADFDALLKQSEKITDSIYLLPHANENIIICCVNGNDILKAEKVLPLLYSKETKNIPNKKYIIYNRHDYVDETFYRSKLSVILKVRAMENYCVVLFEAANINNCYQAGKNRTAQVVAPTNGYYKIDLERASGPEAIWKNKMGMRKKWRNNFEWLIDYATTL